VSTLAFAPGTDVLATGDGHGIITLWNPAGFHQSAAAAGAPESLRTAGGHPPAVLSIRGDVLAVGGEHGTVRFRNALTGRSIGRPVVSHHAVTGLALSPDGKTLALTADAQQEIGTPMTASQEPVYAVAFGPDGSTLVTMGGDGTARSWDVAFPAGLLAATCAVADQSLTREQWASYAGGQAFQQVCPAS